MKIRRKRARGFASGVKPRQDALATPVAGMMAEQTKGQAARGAGGISIQISQPGLSEPPPGTFATYRRMRTNPTVAMARIAATAPVKKAEISVNSTDDAKEEAVEFVKKHIVPMWPWIRNNSLFALDYGYSPFEKVFDLKDGKIILSKLKPLLVDITKIRLEKETGKFAGLEQQSVKLPPEKVFCYVNDSEAGSVYGRSRNENLRREWKSWFDTSIRLGDYGRKIAGVIPIITYPEGESRDASGSMQSNFSLAQGIMDHLGTKMKGIAMPNTFAKWANPSEWIGRGIDPAQLRPWLISFLETKGQHGKDFVEQLRYWDTNMIRGWLIPERAITEGQHGTKAEAVAHIDIAFAVAEELLDDLIRCVNWYIIDQLLVVNFGEEARGTVFLEHGPIIDQDKLFLRGIIEKVIGTPVGFELLFDMLDLEQILDQAGIPQSEVTPLEDLLPRLKADPTGAPAIPPTPTIPGASAPESGGAANVVEGVKLNGAQISAAQSILADVTSGAMADVVAVGLLVAVGLDKVTAEVLVKAAKAHKPPKVSDE